MNTPLTIQEAYTLRALLFRAERSGQLSLCRQEKDGTYVAKVHEFKTMRIDCFLDKEEETVDEIAIYHPAIDPS